MEEQRLTQLESEVQTLRAQREEVSVKLALKEAELFENKALVEAELARVEAARVEARATGAK